MMKLIVVFALITSCVFSYAQKFEGKIVFAYKSLYDSSFYTYSVKDENVRIDEYDKNNYLRKSLLINLQDKSVIAVNPHKKLYAHIATHSGERGINNETEGFDIIKTNTFRKINGYNCNQWRVRVRELNKEITFWVAVDTFEFFRDLIQIIKTNERNLSYFLYIPQIKGALPMLTVERTLMRDEKNSLQVLQVEKSIIKKSLFEIPNDYQAVTVNY